MMSEKIWISVCEIDDLLPDTGVCALVNKQQVAIFRSRKLNEVFAVSNYDPVGCANVLSRGIIGSIGDEVVVASPLYKEHYSLRTGECLEKPEYLLQVFPVRMDEGLVQVQA
jgi:nitrite reductase (NADH) small subunit